MADTTKRSLCVIAGVPFDNLTMDETVARIEDMVARRKPGYVATANVNFVVKSRRDPEFMETVRMADIITADGMPLIWASRLLGAPLKERVTGSDLTPRLAEIAVRKGYRLFFLGGRDDMGNRAVLNLREKYPGIQVRQFSPSFNPLLEMNNREILARIHEFGPDILLILLGAGKAEKWIRMNLKHLRVPVSISVGATIGFLAGEARRVPKLMQDLGLEWLYRLVQEPRRLFPRYFMDFLLFVPPLLWQWACYRRHRLSRREEIPARTTPVPEGELVHCCRIDASSADDFLTEAAASIRPGAPLYLDLSQVTFMDSTGLGALVNLEKLLRDNDSHLAVLRPAPEVLTTLKLTRLDRFLTIYPSMDTARRTLEQRRLYPFAEKEEDEGYGRCLIRLRGRLDASNADGLRKFLLDVSDSREGLRYLRLDMDQVDFIDSSGLAVLLQLYNRLKRDDIGLEITRLSENAARTFKIMKIDRYLGFSVRIPGGKAPKRTEGEAAPRPQAAQAARPRSEREEMMEALYRQYARGGKAATLRLRLRYLRKKWLWAATLGFGHGLKRLLDILGGLAGLAVFSPVLLATALAVKLEDGGPVFFRQTRVGLKGRHFTMYKFRSMRVDAETAKGRLRSDRGDDVTFKMKRDPRVTRTGRIIRKLSIDELPQFINVLRGDMSLVGPRPPLPSEMAKYGQKQRRLWVKPGITCLWQIGGCSELDFESQVNLDLQYIESQSFLKDVGILLRTIPAVLAGKGAY